MDLLDGFPAALDRWFGLRQAGWTCDHHWKTAGDLIPLQPDVLRRGRDVDARPLYLGRTGDHVVHQGQIVCVTQDVDLGLPGLTGIALQPAA